MLKFNDSTTGNEIFANLKQRHKMKFTQYEALTF